MSEKENLLITQFLSIEEKKIFKKYIEEYNDLFQKILILSPSEFISKLNQNVEYSLRFKNNKFPKTLKDKIQLIIAEKIYKKDYKIAQKIKLKLAKENNINKEYFQGEIIPHCDKDKEDGKYYIHSCDEKFLVYELDNPEKNYFLFCQKCNMIYKEDLIKFKCAFHKNDFYSKILLNNNKEEDLPYATWAKYHCHAVINDLMKCQKCSNNLFLLKKNFKNGTKNYLYCKKCKKAWYPSFLQWECLICKKLFTCDAKAYNPLEFKTLKICIKDAMVNKIKAYPEYLECNCNFDFNKVNFFHKASCKGTLFFGELDGKKTVVCEKCDSIGFYDGYIWTCPLCLKKTKNINNKKNNENNFNLNETKSELCLKNKEEKEEKKLLSNDLNIKGDTDSISMSKIPIRKKYKFSITDNSSSNNIKDNINNKDLSEKEINNDKLGKKEIKFKHNLSFSKTDNNDSQKLNELNKESNNDLDNNNNNKNNLQKIKKYLSIINTDKTYFKDAQNNIDLNLKIKSSVLNNSSRNNFQFKLKPSLSTNETALDNNNINENNNKKENEIIKRKNSFMTQFNKYKISAKLSRKCSGEYIDNNNCNKTQNENDFKKKNIRQNKIFYRYKYISGINNKISRNNKINLDINISKDFKTEINNNKNIENKLDIIDKLKENEKKQNIENEYNNKKGSNSTADNSDNTTKIIYHVKNPKQSFQIKKNKINIDLENYKIIKKIGQGSFGQIFEIEDNFKNKYALKKLILTQESDIKKIEHEYQILIDLNSIKKNLNLNLVKIYGFTSKQLDPTTYVIYVLMELAVTDWEKEILQLQRLKSYYTENNLMQILSSLVKTFSQLQKNNVSHRDIKPQNILIFKNGIYKLADFGEAKELYKDLEATNKQTLRGTELYMSPILFQALRSNKMIKYIKHNTYKSDVFSFGLCALFAASLCFESVYDVREAKNNIRIRFILEKYLGKRYSFDTINIISQMLDINETTRKDFIELEQEFSSLGY